MSENVLQGMKSICDFLGRSEATIINWTKIYADTIPIKKIDGRWESDRKALEDWRRDLLNGRIEIKDKAKAKPKKAKKKTTK